MNEEVQMIPIDSIRIINPRVRDKRKFEKIIESIRDLGLKKPIKISRRITRSGEDSGYDLICGQGRMEACCALGYETIAAVVVEVPKEDRLLMSLIENIARRPPSTMDLIREIERLKDVGYSNVAIGRKLGIAGTTVGGYLALSQAGEERLLQAAIKGEIPVSVAIEISKADTREMQRQLLTAYEKKELNPAAVRAVRRIVQKRQTSGRALKQAGPSSRAPTGTTTESLVNSLRKESLRQKTFIKKARVCENRVTIIVAAFKQILADEDFVTLLRAEGLNNLPSVLANKLKSDIKSSA